MKALNKILFPKIYWWLLLLLPFVFFGFYRSYFSKLFSSMPSIFHIHAFFMLLWVATAIVQPFLIKQKKTKLHKSIGKISYLLMPVVFITAYLVIRHSYTGFIEFETDKVAKGVSDPGTDSILTKAAANIMIGSVYLFWLMLFYTLAVINRKKILVHATYMFAAILTLLGPTVDRILFQVYDYYGMGFNLFAETAVFVLIDLLLFALLIYQRRKGNNVKTVATALLIYMAGQAAYFLLPKMAFWKLFVELIM